MCSHLFGDYTNPSSYSHKILQACFSHYSTCTSSLVAGVLSQSSFKLCQSFTAAPPHCPRTPSHRETNTGSGKPFCFITKERKTRSTFSENTRLVCFVFFCQKYYQFSFSYEMLLFKQLHVKCFHLLFQGLGIQIALVRKNLAFRIFEYLSWS